MLNFSEMTDAEVIQNLSQDYKMPFMLRVNGIGSTMLGKLRENKKNTYYFKMFCFTFVFLPIYLRSIYYVREDGSTVHSQGFISKRDFKRLFGARLYRKLVLSVLWEYVFVLLVVSAVAGGVWLYVLYEKYNLHR